MCRCLRLSSLLSFVFFLATHHLCAQVAVTTYHNDNGRTGQNVNETTLTLANVNAKKFGKLFAGSVNLDGWAAAQPLYVPGVLANGSMHNVAYVATLNNSVFAFDADSGTELWMNHYGSPTPYASLCADSGFAGSPSKGAGIVGTPAIDAVAGIVYFVAKTGNGSGASPFALYLHAVDYATGLDKPGSPVLIAPTQGPTFYAKYQMARPGLLLSNGVIYLGLGSTGCKGLKAFPAVNNHGWILGFNTMNLAAPPLTFVTTPKTDNGGIWQSGGGLAQDESGDIYFETADAVFDYTSGGMDFGNSVIKLDSNLKLVDYFTPYNQATLLNPQDLEPGSVGPVVLPDQTIGAPHLLIASGKTEEIFLLNRDNMGAFCATCTASNTNIVQDVPAPSFLTGCQQPVLITDCRYGAPSYWNNTVYFPGEVAPLLSYSLTNGMLSTMPAKTSTGYQNVGPVSISSNGTSNGIVWSITWGGGANTLRAFNALTLAQIYSSDLAPKKRDTLGPVAHFATPTVANGKVFVATQTQLVAYGLY